MSLINDALRRAAQNPPTPVSATETKAGLEVVNYQAAAGRRWPVLVGIPAVILLLCVSGWFMSRAARTATHGTPVVEAPTGVSSDRSTVPSPSAEPKSPRKFAALPSESVGQPKATSQVAQVALSVTNLFVQTHSETELSRTNGTPSDPSVDAKSTNAPAVAESAPPKPALPNLKLQGVYFRRVNPSVLINGRTLFVGDSIENARVAAIQMQSVTMIYAGKTNVLDLQ